MPVNLVGKHGVLHGFGARAKALGKGDQRCGLPKESQGIWKTGTGGVLPSPYGEVF